MAPRLFKAYSSGLGVALHITPGASRAKIVGLVSEADGTQALKVAVTAPPEDGKANQAVIKLLAKEWRLPKSTFSIATGATQRRKTIMIQGDARVLETKIKDWLRQQIAA